MLNLCRWTAIGWPHKIEVQMEQTYNQLEEDEERFRKLQTSDQANFNDRLDTLQVRQALSDLVVNSAIVKYIQPSLVLVKACWVSSFVAQKMAATAVRLGHSGYGTWEHGKENWPFWNRNTVQVPMTMSMVGRMCRLFPLIVVKMPFCLLHFWI